MDWPNWNLSALTAATGMLSLGGTWLGSQRLQERLGSQGIQDVGLGQPTAARSDHAISYKCQVASHVRGGGNHHLNSTILAHPPMYIFPVQPVGQRVSFHRYAALCSRGH